MRLKNLKFIALLLFMFLSTSFAQEKELELPAENTSWFGMKTES